MPQAISNANLINMCRDCGAVGFLPTVSYVYDATAGTVTLTNTSTIPAGDTFLKMKAQLFDRFGNEVRRAQTVQATALVLNVTGLNLSKPLDLKVLVLTTGKISADGGAYYLQPAGGVSSWDVKKNA